jgi:hypothetical protein
MLHFSDVEVVAQHQYLMRAFALMHGHGADSLTLDKAQGLENKNVAPTPWLRGKKCIKRCHYRKYSIRSTAAIMSKNAAPVRNFDTFARSNTYRANEWNLTPFLSCLTILQPRGV